VERKRAFGIHGSANRVAGQLSRFGWKAQTTSLEQFVAEAYLAEQGVTNELFPEEMVEPPTGCRFGSLPEDRRNLMKGGLESHSNVARLVQFVRYLAPPTPGPESVESRRGRSLFDSIGCGLCHTPSFRVSGSAYHALNGKDAALFSDLLLHDMGASLADGIQQGRASAVMFRTAPLWGLGHRVFLLHDGRTTDLVEAIEAHGDRRGSEGNRSVERFRALTPKDKQDLLIFSRSL